MHQWHRVVARPGAYEADISTGSCHDPVPMLALDIGTGANDHPVPKAGLSLLDIFKSLTTPHSYLYPSHFSTSHLSLPYPLSLKKPGVRAASRWPLPRSARAPLPAEREELPGVRAASRWPLPPPGTAVVRRRRAGPHAEARHRRDPRRVQELHVRRVLQEVLEQEPGPGALLGALQDLAASGPKPFFFRKVWLFVFNVLQIRSTSLLFVVADGLQKRSFGSYNRSISDKVHTRSRKECRNSQNTYTY